MTMWEHIPKKFVNAIFKGWKGGREGERQRDRERERETWLFVGCGREIRHFRRLTEWSMFLHPESRRFWVCMEANLVLGLRMPAVVHWMFDYAFMAWYSFSTHEKVYMSEYYQFHTRPVLISQLHFTKHKTYFDGQCKRTFIALELAQYEFCERMSAITWYTTVLTA